MSLDPRRSQEPLSYYWRETPIGVLFADATAAKPETLRAGVIGMGMGSSTCYAKVGQDWTVFEIDQDVVKAATDPKLIGFINRCAPYTKIVMGDARIQMQQQPNDWFDILLVDAFSSDAIPTHMITKEAIASFMTKIAPDGIMIVHISNRYLELSDIVGDAAHSLGYAAMLGDREGSPDNPNADTGVRVVVIARTPDRFASYRLPMWSLMMPSKNPKPWTDDHTDILKALAAN
jgi:spermidine synthase